MLASGVIKKIGITNKYKYGFSCILFFFKASVFIVRNEEKQVTILVYSSFKGVPSRSLRRISVSITTSSKNHSN